MTGTRGRIGGHTRRAALSRAAGLALAPMLALALPSGAARALVPARAPTGPVRLVRILERGLADGNSLVVTREWMCAFADEGPGMTVHGDQIRVDVEAPAMLAPLAEIEKRRRVDGLFPATLDEAGQIVAAGGSSDSSAILRASDRAAALLDTFPETAFAGEDPDAFIAQLSGTAAQVVSRVPRDLFFPEEGESSDTRRFPIGEGEFGEVEVSLCAKARASDGLLVHSERLVSTRFQGRERVSRERWALEEI